MRHLLVTLSARWTYGPLYLFVGGSILLFVLLYVAPLPLVWVVLGGVLSICFVLFLKWCRPTQQVAIGSVAPAVIGPFLTNVYIKVRHSPLEILVAPSLAPTTDALIQLTFFFASFIGLLVQAFVILGQSDQQAPGRLKQLAMFVVLIPFAFIAFAPELTHSWRSGPTLAWGISAPPLTGLTICRLVVGLWSIILATFPTRESAQPVSAGSMRHA